MKRLIGLFFVVLMTLPIAAQADGDVSYEGPATWRDFENYMREREEQDRTIGLSYMISGGVAAIGGIAGYYASDDVLGRGVFAISQTLGVAAMGYGASIYWNGNEYDSFYRAVRDSSLSPLQKTELLRRFLENERNERDRERWIRAGTHLLLSMMNFYSASQESDKDVSGIFQFLGGVNLAIAVSYSF